MEIKSTFLVQRMETGRVNVKVTLVSVFAMLGEWAVVVVQEFYDAFYCIEVDRPC